VTASAPGNVILLGEYAVLEEGGLGVAFAVNKRVRLAAEPASRLSVEPASPVVSAVVAAVQKARAGAPEVRIRIDSSELHLPDGRKAGFGSSAAVAVALVRALLRERSPEAACLELALAAHRAAQGGVGSGYDVCCSFFGGWGMFSGGAKPSWKPHAAPHGSRVYLFAGPAAVSTRDAIRSFIEWKAKENHAARTLIQESNDNVNAFLDARHAREVAAAFRRARETGIALGDEIGVEARIPVPSGVDPDLCKAVGAGNELGAYLQIPGAPEPAAGSGLLPVRESESGVTWTP
jgi:phosphomevalonate kinase